LRHFKIHFRHFKFLFRHFRFSSALQDSLPPLQVSLAPLQDFLPPLPILFRNSRRSSVTSRFPFATSQCSLGNQSSFFRPHGGDSFSAVHSTHTR
jgi:hypothetical protein